MTRGPATEKIRLGIVVALIVACFIWGGGSRLDIPGLILLQPFAILCLIALLLIPGPMRWDTVRAPLLLLLALALVIAVQLIPLPPEIWTQLPGQQRFLPVAAVAGGEQMWRPLSLTPDYTLAALIGLAIPAAALVGFASLTTGQSHRLMTWLLIAALVSAVFGVAQLLGGPNSLFYRYSITNDDFAVGLFSNRNHQALFLVITWPMLALWATRPTEDTNQYRARYWVAIAAGVAMLPVLAATGSRAGIVLALPALAMAWYLLRTGVTAKPARATPGQTALRYLIAGVAVATVVALAVILPRQVAFERWYATSVGDELRVAFMPTLLKMTGDFLPFGSGFGSFDPVFRAYEPDQLLARNYFNHAHNDLIELVITGGIPALAVAIAFLGWAALRMLATVRGERGSRHGRYALVGGTIIALVLLSSLVDYPLRTPVFSVIFAFACGWLGADRRRQAEDRNAGERLYPSSV